MDRSSKKCHSYLTKDNSSQGNARTFTWSGWAKLTGVDIAQYLFADGVVTASYGSATARAHADTLFTAQDESDGLGTECEVKI